MSGEKISPYGKCQHCIFRYFLVVRGRDPAGGTIWGCIAKPYDCSTYLNFSKSLVKQSKIQARRSRYAS